MLSVFLSPIFTEDTDLISVLIEKLNYISKSQAILDEKGLKLSLKFRAKKNPQKTSFLARKFISLTEKYLNIDVESFESEFESVCGQK